MKTVRELLKYSKEKMKAVGIETYSIDSECLLSYILNIPREKLIIRLDELYSEKDYIKAVEKRCSGYPLQYIINKQEFMSLDFYVDENVLIPRQDTEILVENAIKYCKNKKNLVLLDMCTGSGCIAISLAYYVKDTKILATDISEDALNIARKNAENNNVKHIMFIKSDLFSNIPQEYAGKIDMILSNPPYIRNTDIPSLSIEVREYEPKIALDGGTDGLDFYRRISEQSKLFLTSNGILMFEIGYDQAEKVRNILEYNGYTNIEVIKDLAGLDRVVTAHMN